MVINTRQKNYYENNREDILLAKRENYVRSTKALDRQVNELLTIAYIANLNSGKLFSVVKVSTNTLNGFSTEYLKTLLDNGWSDACLFSKEIIGKVVSVNRMTVNRDILKFMDNGFMINIGKYRIDGSKYDSDVYMVNTKLIQTTYYNEYFFNYDDLGNKYFGYITKQNKSSIALNNECMTKPLFIEASALINDYNNSINNDKFKVHFLELTEDGDYKYGRYYNSICISKNPERNKDSDRLELLKEYFEQDAEFEEFDVNSMMLRTSYNLINDKVLESEVDIYYKLYLSMNVNTPLLNENTFKNSKERAFIKANVMPIYMDPRSVYCKIDAMYKSRTDMVELNKLKNDYTHAEIAELESLFGKTYDKFLNDLKEALYVFLSYETDKGLHRVFFGKMFFKYEAIMYYYMRNEFKAIGIDTINVYDGFYFIKNTCTQELFEEVYNKAIQLTKDLLNKHNHDVLTIYSKSFSKTNYESKYVPNKFINFNEKKPKKYYAKNNTNMYVLPCPKPYAEDEINAIIATATKLQSLGIQAIF